jgi:hypothetical protein
MTSSGQVRTFGPLPGVTPTAYDYGFLPPALFNELKALIIEKSRSRTVHIVARTK